MLDDHSLPTLLDRVLQNDTEACELFFKEFESVVRRAIRVHLTRDNPLRRYFDSTDISQSMWKDFFKKQPHRRLKELSLDSLKALLVTMAEQKFKDKRRRFLAVRRNYQRTLTGIALQEIPDEQPDDDSLMMESDLCEKIRPLLSPEEQQIFDFRLAGKTYPEIAQVLRRPDDAPANPDTLRLTLRRAFKRVAANFRQNHD
jgi:DNA-directed RNA polymerase specialized sigma24 family protein